MNYKNEHKIDLMVNIMTADCTGDYWHLDECRDKDCDHCKAEKLLRAGWKK